MNLFRSRSANCRKSVAYISNGYLGFEMNWLDRFYETNRTMKRLSLGDNIEPLAPSDIIMRADMLKVLIPITGFHQNVL